LSGSQFKPPALPGVHDFASLQEAVKIAKREKSKEDRENEIRKDMLLKKS
jgi:hypothetical protein